MLAKVEDALHRLDDISQLKGSNVNDAIKDALFTAEDWSSEGVSGKPVALAGWLDGALHDFIYTRNTINAIVGLKPSSTMNMDDLKIVVDALKNNVNSKTNKKESITGIYYTAKISKTNPKRVGNYFYSVSTDNYTTPDSR